MKKKGILILVILALIGAGMDEGLKDFRLTEEQEEKAKQIALFDPEVKKEDTKRERL